MEVGDPSRNGGVERVEESAGVGRGRGATMASATEGVLCRATPTMDAAAAARRAAGDVSGLLCFVFYRYVVFFFPLSCLGWRLSYFLMPLPVHVLLIIMIISGLPMLLPFTLYLPQQSI